MPEVHLLFHIINQQLSIINISKHLIILQLIFILPQKQKNKNKT
jgi:hypothetical protein